MASFWRWEKVQTKWKKKMVVVFSLCAHNIVIDLADDRFWDVFCINNVCFPSDPLPKNRTIAIFRCKDGFSSRSHRIIWCEENWFFMGFSSNFHFAVVCCDNKNRHSYYRQMCPVFFSHFSHFRIIMRILCLFRHFIYFPLDLGRFLSRHLYHVLFISLPLSLNVSLSRYRFARSIKVFTFLFIVAALFFLSSVPKCEFI